jgi:hypothetical protein
MNQEFISRAFYFYLKKLLLQRNLAAPTLLLTAALGARPLSYIIRLAIANWLSSFMRRINAPQI